MAHSEPDKGIGGRDVDCKVRRYKANAEFAPRKTLLRQSQVDVLRKSTEGR